MKLKTKYIIPAFILVTALSARAVDDTFSRVVNTIVDNNPSIAAKRASTKASAELLSADNNLRDPEIEFEHQWGQDNIGNKWSLSVSQSFDWPGLYAKRAEIARHSGSAMEFLLQSDILDLRLKASETLIDYINAVKRYRSAIEIIENLDTVSAYLERAYDRRAVTVLDLNKARFERANALTAADDALVAVNSLSRELQALSGGMQLDLSSLDEYPALVLSPEDVYLESYEKNSPSLMAARSAVLSADSKLAAEKMSLFPGFSLGYIHNVEIGEHFNGLKVGVELPVFSRRHRKAAAIAEKEAASQQLVDIDLAARQEIYSRYAAASAAGKRLVSYNALFAADGSRDDYRALLQKSFFAGQITLINYLYELNYYIEAKQNYLDLQYRYYQSLVQLERYR